MKKTLVLSNSASGLYEFRKELIQNLMGSSEVYLSLPEGDDDKYVELFKQEGCHVIHTPFERRGMNPLKDMELMVSYRKMIGQIGPDIVLTYTIKPNIYGGLACKGLKVPYITNITGLGTAILSGGMLSRILMGMYRMATSKAKCIFFQNSSNMEFMKSHGITGKGNLRLLPGSGVNLEAHPYSTYPPEENGIVLLSVMRIMKDKGIEELLSAVDKLGSDKIHFTVAGAYEEESREEYEPRIEELVRQGKLDYLGFVDDMDPVYAKSHIIVHPSYHEGLSNVCLEAAACGRPVITTDVPGCRETVSEDSGILCQPVSAQSLISALEKILALSSVEREAMGRAGREHVEKNFDRNLVIQAYREEIR